MRTARNSPTPRERFDEYLRAAGKRRTPERYAILATLMQSPGHFTADELGAKLREAEYPVAPATVYSTLELLVDCGLALRRRFSDKANVYERTTTLTADHHHLICTVCGKIKEVRDQALSDLINSRKFAGFNQSYFSLNIYGVCGSCSRKRHKDKNVSQ